MKGDDSLGGIFIRRKGEIAPGSSTFVANGFFGDHHKGIKVRNVETDSLRFLREKTEGY